MLLSSWCNVLRYRIGLHCVELLYVMPLCAVFFSANQYQTTLSAFLGLLLLLLLAQVHLPPPASRLVLFPVWEVLTPPDMISVW